MPRIEPFTKKELASKTCVRCGRRAGYQWNICSDDNTWRPVCGRCDIELNLLVLKFMRFRNWRSKMLRYCKKMRRKPPINLEGNDDAH